MTLRALTGALGVSRTRNSYGANSLRRGTSRRCVLQRKLTAPGTDTTHSSSPSTFISSAFRIAAPAAPRTVLCPSAMNL